jgi:hypothetical protein
MPRERVRDTFAKRFDLAKHVDPAARVTDSWHDRRRFGALRCYALTRMAPARSWLGRFKRGCSAACVRVSGEPSSAGERVGSALAVPFERHWGVRGLSDAGKAHPAE